MDDGSTRTRPAAGNARESVHKRGPAREVDAPSPITESGLGRIDRSNLGSIDLDVGDWGASAGGDRDRFEPVTPGQAKGRGFEAHHRANELAGETR